MVRLVAVKGLLEPKNTKINKGRRFLPNQVRGNWPYQLRRTMGGKDFQTKILGETNFRTQEIPQSGSKAIDGEEEKRETGGRDRTLAVKSEKNARKSGFCRKKIKIT